MFFNIVVLFTLVPILTSQPIVHHIVDVDESDQRNHNTNECQGLHKFLDQVALPDQGEVLLESPDEEPQRNADHRLAENKVVVDTCHLVKGCVSIYDRVYMFVYHLLREKILMHHLLQQGYSTIFFCNRRSLVVQVKVNVEARQDRFPYEADVCVAGRQSHR